jgi:hypothetical protein
MVHKSVFRENRASGDYNYWYGTGLDGSGGALFNAAVATLRTACSLQTVPTAEWPSLMDYA